MNLKVITKPTIEPVTLDFIKSYLRIFSNDFDIILNSLIKTARIEVEKYTSRALMKQTIELSFDEIQDDIIILPRPPLLNLLSVKLYDEDDVENSVSLSSFVIDSISEPCKIKLKNSLSYPSVILRELGGFKIVYEAGATNPDEVSNEMRTAIAFYVGFRYEYPECSEIPKAFYNMLNYERVVNV